MKTKIDGAYGSLELKLEFVDSNLITVIEKARELGLQPGRISQVHLRGDSGTIYLMTESGAFSDRRIISRYVSDKYVYAIEDYTHPTD